MSEYETKTKDQLIDKLMELQGRISELKKSENQLKLAEEAYHALVDHSLQGLVIFQEGRIIFTNEAFAKISGYTVEELLKLSPEEVRISVYPDDQELVWSRNLDRLKGESVPKRYAFRGIRKDGSMFWVEIYASLIKYQGKPAIQAAFIDITERKKAEEALRESEKRLRELIDLLPEIVFETDMEGNFTFVNQIGFDIFGYTREDFDKGLNVLQMIALKDRDRAKENLRRALSGEVLGISEYIAQRKDGSTFPVIIHSSLITDGEGNTVGLRGIVVNITEHKWMQEALRESEKRFRELAELLPQTVFETDKKGNLTFTNAYGLKSSGYTQENIDKGLNALQLFIPEDRDRVKENMLRILGGEKLGGIEYTGLRKDGSTFPVIIYSSIIIRENKPVGLRGIVIDITELKKVEKALRESEKKYRDLVENINDVIYAIDKDGVMTYISPVIESIIGYNPSEIIGCTFSDFVHKEDLKSMREGFQKRLSGHLAQAEYRILTKSGEIRWIRTDSKPTFMENRVVGVQGVLTDVTERKKAEKALRESEEKFRSLAEHSPNMIFINKKGSIVYANKKCEDIVGYTKEEFYSPNFDFFSLIAPESLEKVKSNFSKHMRGEEVLPYDYTLITKDGKRIEAILTTSLIDYEGEKSILGTVTDITERKRAEEALQISSLQYRTTLDSMADAIHVVDKDLRIILFNQALKQWAGELGLKIDVVGQTVFEAFPFLPDKVRDEYLQVFNTGETLISEEFTKISDREYITEARKIPVLEGKKVVRVVTVVRDVTEQKKAEEALKQRAEELERSKAELQKSLEELLERVEREHEGLITIPSPAIDIEEKGALFLYPLDREKEAYNLFLSRKKSKRPALAITRTFPPRFHMKLGRELETVWLTSNRVSDMVCVDPSDTMNLLLVITEFFKRAPKGVVLFEGVEYIISIVGFRRFLQIVQLLNDKIAMTEGAIYMILDLGVLEEKEKRYILRESLSPFNGFRNGEEIEDFKNED